MMNKQPKNLLIATSSLTLLIGSDAIASPMKTLGIENSTKFYVSTLLVSGASSSPKKNLLAITWKDPSSATTPEARIASPLITRSSTSSVSENSSSRSSSPESSIWKVVPATSPEAAALDQADAATTLQKMAKNYLARKSSNSIKKNLLSSFNEVANNKDITTENETFSFDDARTSSSDNISEISEASATIVSDTRSAKIKEFFDAKHAKKSPKIKHDTSTISYAASTSEDSNDTFEPKNNATSNQVDLGNGWVSITSKNTTSLPANSSLMAVASPTPATVSAEKVVVEEDNGGEWTLVQKRTRGKKNIVPTTPVAKSSAEASIVEEQNVELGDFEYSAKYAAIAKAKKNKGKTTYNLQGEGNWPVVAPEEPVVQATTPAPVTTTSLPANSSLMVVASPTPATVGAEKVVVEEDNGGEWTLVQKRTRGKKNIVPTTPVAKSSAEASIVEEQNVELGDFEYSAKYAAIAKAKKNKGKTTYNLQGEGNWPVVAPAEPVVQATTPAPVTTTSPVTAPVAPVVQIPTPRPAPTPSPAVAQPANVTTKANATMVGATEITNTISTILNNRARSPISIVEATAAGDDRSYGLWTKGFASSAIQKGEHTAKTRTFGGTIGGDIDLIEDKMLLGVAFTHAKLDAKIKGEDTIRANVNMGSIYTNYEISKQAFVSANISYGQVDIKNLTFAGSKNKGNAFKANASLGYNIALDNGAIITPEAGLSFNTIKLKDLKPTSSASKRKANMERITTDLSLSIAKDFKINDQLNLKPTIHFGISHMLKQNNLSDKASHLMKEQKAPKTSYNTGISVLAYGANAISLDVGYNLNFKPKYKAHSGFVKLEVKF